MESVGFKEWALVCEALGRGEQTVILRKGGIAEGRDGFVFRHREFFLFPTFFHEQVERVRTPGAEFRRTTPAKLRSATLEGGRGSIRERVGNGGGAGAVSHPECERRA